MARLAKAEAITVRASFARAPPHARTRRPCAHHHSHQPTPCCARRRRRSTTPALAASTTFKTLRLQKDKTDVVE